MNNDDKYKWHDLREDPDDLPESEEVKVLAYETKTNSPHLRNNPTDLPDRKNYLFSYYVLAYNGCDFGVCFYDFACDKWKSFDVNMMDEVGTIEIYAWRYIEPFEGGRENDT